MKNDAPAGQSPSPAVCITRRRSEGDRPQLEAELARLLAERGLDAYLAPDLYHAPSDHPSWATLRSVAVVGAFGWLHPRPLRALLQAHGVGGNDLPVFDLNAFSDADQAAKALFEAIGTPALRSAGAGSVTDLGTADDHRWYPVVDRSRCAGCQHCLQFCLFGVYSLDAEGQPVVVAPDNCKHGCPACARICPRSAIMFPLYVKEPAIAGAPGQFVVLDDDARRMFDSRVGLRGRQPEPAPAAAAPDSPELDELDALIDELDSLRPGGRP